MRKSLPDDVDEPVTQTVDLNSRAIVERSIFVGSRSHRSENTPCS